MHKGSYTDCLDWYPFQASVLQDLGSSIANLKNSDTSFDMHNVLLNGCTYCERRAGDWRHTIRVKVSSIPKFDPML